MSGRAYRLNASPGGMLSLAAMTPQEAGDFVRRELEDGAETVEVEMFEIRTDEDLTDAWGCSRWIARTAPVSA